MIESPFHDLLSEAHRTHRDAFDPGVVEGAQLLSIKTGACPEDCAYCPQSAVHITGLRPEPLLPLETIMQEAVAAKVSGATRFCMGAAWRAPSDSQVARVTEAVEAVAALGLETCVTLGMLTDAQAQSLASSGLDYYNHNLDTSPEFYDQIITTRTYDDRLETLQSVRNSGVKLCTGGIIGMGESVEDRAAMLAQLASMNPHPESVPINLLIKIPGTPLAEVPDVHGFDLVRVIAAARIAMPRSVLRLSAGRSNMSDELQALCLHAGANSIFLGDRLLTADNPGASADDALLDRLNTTVSPVPL